MKIFIFFLSIFLITISIADDVSEDSRQQLNVAVGIDKVINLDFVPDTRVSVGNQSILNYSIVPAKKEIIFKGIQAGKTSVDIRDSVGDIKARYIIDVSSDDKSKVVADLHEFLGDVEGLEIGMKGGIVYVGGQIVVPRDIGRVVMILSRYPDVVKLVELSPQTKKVIARKMQEEIHKADLKNVTVRIVNGVFWLEGVCEFEKCDQLAINIAKAYLPDKLADLATLQGTGFLEQKRDDILSFISINTKDKPKPPEKQIKVTGQFVELAKDYGKIFGVHWAPTLDAGGGAITFGKTNDGSISTTSGTGSTSSDGTTTKANTLSGVISNLFPKLSNAKSAGYARVVQSGMVLTKEKVTANIAKEIEVNFSVGSGDTQEAKLTKIGFNLKVTPQIVDNEKVEMDIGINVNIPTAQGMTQPANNSISTTVIVNNKESAVIGGVVQNTMTTAYDKDPIMEIPRGTALFDFMRSKSYQTAKNQFVVFVTPEIIESASEGTEEVRKKFRKRSR